MWLNGAMRRVAQDVRAIAPRYAGFGLGQPWRHRHGTTATAETGLAHVQAAPPKIDADTTDIGNFEPSSDALVCIWDDSIEGSPAPKVSMEADPDRKGCLRVRLGANIVATVHGAAALTSAELAVMPLSSAQALGLAPTDRTALQ